MRCVAGGWWFAGKSSPCSGCLRLDRDNFLPARVKWAELCVFCCAGRVLYRFGLEVGVAGRVLYRGVCAAWVVGGGLREKVLPARVVCVWTGIIFSLLALNGPNCVFFAVLGEFCTGCGLTRRVLGEFCTGLALRWGCWESFVPGSVRCVAGEWWFAGKGSPCSGCLRRDRDNFLPARVKWAEMGGFSCVGRVLYRFGLEVGLLGEFCTGECALRGW